MLGSAATAGLTAATVMLTLTLSTLGLPLEGAGLLLAIDPIIDMGRTAVNVNCQGAGARDRRQAGGILDEARLSGRAFDHRAAGLNKTDAVLLRKQEPRAQ